MRARIEPMFFQGATTVPDAASASQSVGDPGATRLVYLIVVLLVLIAAGLGFFAFTFWQRTRPGREHVPRRSRSAGRARRSGYDDEYEADSGESAGDGYDDYGSGPARAGRRSGSQRSVEWDRDERAQRAERAARERHAAERRRSAGDDRADGEPRRERLFEDSPGPRARAAEPASPRGPRPNSAAERVRPVDPILDGGGRGATLPRTPQPGASDRVRIQPRPAVRPAGTPPPKPAAPARGDREPQDPRSGRDPRDPRGPRRPQGGAGATPAPVPPRPRPSGPVPGPVPNHRPPTPPTPTPAAPPSVASSPVSPAAPAPAARPRIPGDRPPPPKGPPPRPAAPAEPAAEPAAGTDTAGPSD